MFTILSEECFSLTAFRFLHISNVALDLATAQTLTISLEQHNPLCDFSVAPYPETWGGVDLRRYLQPSGDVWVPLAHFRINLRRVAALSFKALFQSSAVTMGRIEFTSTIPATVIVPAIAPQSPLRFHCGDPNSIALCIDDGM